MRKIFSLLLLLAFFVSTNAQDAVLARDPIVITGHLVKVIPSLKDYQPLPLNNDIIVRDLSGIVGKPKSEGKNAPDFGSLIKADGALQDAFPKDPKIPANNAVTANFNGIGYQPLNPPDPTLCVGPNHVIQMVNGSSGALFKVFNKAGGQVQAQTYLDNITGKGGLGDPICLYDQLADRFILTEFNNSNETGSEGLTIAVSQTGNPTGAWYVYFFSTGSIFPDYPKFGIWNDAYYATTNDFAPSYVGSSVYAFDRTKMLAGNATATVQRFTLGSSSKHFTMCPVTLEGNTLPPAGTGGLIAYMFDDAWTGSAGDVDSIGMFEFKVNFTTPALTVITTKSSLAAAAFKSDICNAYRGQCISMPGSASKLEALHQRIMNQPVYRRFAGYEGIVMTHAVDKGGNIAGVRWYELRKTVANWSIYQQSTYAPDNTNRWMSGVCYDSYGNIGLAYNVSSSATSVYPGARYTGRNECDPLNMMTHSETTLIAGSIANGSTRYGDYCHLICDPDGINFWFTAEYNTASTWNTRISSFNLGACNPPLCGNPSNLSASAIGDNTATVSWTAVANAISYDVDYKLASSANWINAATATVLTSVVLNGLTQNSIYDWRVVATCVAGNGIYIGSQFTTTGPPLPCGPVTGLVTSAITSTTATQSWNTVNGAITYDYCNKLSSSSNWSVPFNVTTTTVYTSGMQPNTSYDWRVRPVCAGSTGSYVVSSFTTLPACATVTGLTTSAITISSATLNWSAVSGALNYNVDYKLSSSANWINAATALAATSKNLTGLTPNSMYDWRVRANCNSSTGLYASAQFTTINGCPDILEPNNTLGSAAAVSTGVNINAQIASATDNDYYSFSNTNSQKKIRVTLTNLPADYDIKLYKGNKLLATAATRGTGDEILIYNATKKSTYKVYVYGFNGAFNNNQCYTMNIQLSATNFIWNGAAEDAEDDDNEPDLYSKQVTTGFKLYPVPANHSVTVSFDAVANGTAQLIISNQLGQQLVSKTVPVNNGSNFISQDVSKLANGTYFLKVITSKEVYTQKIQVIR